VCSSSREPSRPRHRGDWWAGRLVSAVLGGCDGPFLPSCQDVFRWGLPVAVSVQRRRSRSLR